MYVKQISPVIIYSIYYLAFYPRALKAMKKVVNSDHSEASISFFPVQYIFIDPWLVGIIRLTDFISKDKGVQIGLYCFEHTDWHVKY